MKRDPTQTITTFADAAIMAWAFALEDALLRGRIHKNVAAEIRAHASEYWDALLAGKQLIKADGAVTVEESGPSEVVDIDPSGEVQ